MIDTRWFGIVTIAACLLAACSSDGNKKRFDDDDGSASGGGGSGGGFGGGASNSSSGASSSSGGSMCDNGPLAAPIAGCTPTPPEKTGDFGQDCVDRINQFRWECQCLPPLARWTAAESCTEQQSQADQQANAPHGHFGDCGENAQNTCPNWGSDGSVIDGCLQLMWDEGPGEPFSAHGHYINMSSQQYSKVACGRAGNGGQVWSNQNFAP